MANDLVSQVMKDLARRASVVSAASYSARENVPSSNLSSEEDEFLRRLARDGRDFSSDNAGKAAKSCLSECRNLNPLFENVRKTAASSISGNKSQEVRTPRRNFAPLGKNAIELDELAERLEERRCR